MHAIKKNTEPTEPLVIPVGSVVPKTIKEQLQELLDKTLTLDSVIKVLEEEKTNLEGQAASSVQTPGPLEAVASSLTEDEQLDLIEEVIQLSLENKEEL